MANRLNTNIQNEIASIMPLLNTVARYTTDPVTADQQARYRADGLSYISNNQSIIPRDAAGNITMEEGLTTNPLLIIDPVTEQITTKSALRILDTSFQYYKFPATIRETDAIDDLIVDLDFESDTIAARYTIPAEIDSNGQPVTLQRIATSGSDDWFTTAGEFTSGTSRLPFVGGNQAEIGTYTITPDVIDALKAKRKTLRFNIQAQFNSAIKNTTGFTVTLGRSMPEQYRTDGLLYQLYSESYGIFGKNEYPFFELEYVVDIMDDAVPYDKYSINVSATNRSWVLPDNCFWKIDVIDIPNSPSLSGTIGYGAYSFSDNTTLREISEKTVYDSELGREVTRVTITDLITKN
jgi:hypothetical protein